MVVLINNALTLNRFIHLHLKARMRYMRDMRIGGMRRQLTPTRTRLRAAVSTHSG